MTKRNPGFLRFGYRMAVIIVMNFICCWDLLWVYPRSLTASLFGGMRFLDKGNEKESDCLHIFSTASC